MKFLLLNILTLGLLIANSNPFAPSATGYYAPQATGDGNIISITDYHFDPLVGSPSLPENLSYRHAPSVENNYYLVQLYGPIYQYMLDQITAAGAELLGCHSRYNFIARMNARVKEKISNLSFVRWTGLYQPAYKLYQHTLNGTARSMFLVYFFYTEDFNQATRSLESMGINIVDFSNTDIIKFFYIDCPRADLTKIANLPGVYWIEEWFPSEPENNQAQWVNQKGLPPNDTTRAVWRQGIFGYEEILGYTDTGLDVNHYAFQDPVIAMTDTGEYPLHRKVVVFKKYPPASGVGDPNGHGTHVGGTIAGNDSAMGGGDDRDGHSKSARISHLCPIPSSSYNFITVFNILTNTLNNPSLRTHTISNSWWTGTMGTYSAKSMEVDLFCWQNKDVVMIKSCGNQGQSSQYRITEPGNSKSIISMGALLNGTSATSLATYSSRGPAPDGRIKPDCSAPGSSIYSAQRNTNNSYASMSGTSMAAPSCNGCVGLIREYLRTGWYPTGTKVPANAMAYVSAALLKAMILVSCDPNVGSYVIPSDYIGWGRIDLDSVLYFAQPTPDARKLILYDDTLGLATGQYADYNFAVNDTTLPLRAAVVWTDTAAAAGANPALINDLDVRMISASGDSFKGNIYSGGQSLINPTASYDSINPLECFRVNIPRSGVWTLRVMAANVVTRPQPYAVVITGGVSTDIGIKEISINMPDLISSELFKIFPNPVYDNIVLIKLTQPISGNAILKIYDATGSLVKTLYDNSHADFATEKFIWNCQDNNKRKVAPGVYFVKLETGQTNSSRGIVILK